MLAVSHSVMYVAKLSSAASYAWFYFLRTVFILDLASLECLLISILCPLTSAGGSQFTLCSITQLVCCVCWGIQIILVLTDAPLMSAEGS